MCSECDEEGEPICFYCGTPCYGSCGDLDTCPCCWSYKNDPMHMSMDSYDDEAIDECMEGGCNCECHDDLIAMGDMKFAGGVWKDAEDEDGPPFVREGVFPFLKLPGEIREKIYGYAFLQDGHRRQPAGNYHRGTIHTALLGTCRQIYKEAGYLPLSLNTLNFSSALYALNYLGFLLMPSQKHLVTSIHVEFYYPEFSSSSWELLLDQLTKMPVSHLGLTIKGGCPKEAFLGHTCFANRFAAAMKGVKTFDVILGSGNISKKIKEDIQEEMRETLIQGYKRPKNSKKKTKRGVASENGDKKPAKKVKKTPHIKHQTKLVISSKPMRLGMKSQKAEREVAEAATENTKQSLLAQYDKLKQYATSIEIDAGLVKIRLEDAHKAAESAEKEKFEQLARDILVTLEERYNRITAARYNTPLFAKAASPVASDEPSSSQESSDCTSSQDSLMASVDL